MIHASMPVGLRLGSARLAHVPDYASTSAAIPQPLPPAVEHFSTPTHRDEKESLRDAHLAPRRPAERWPDSSSLRATAPKAAQSREAALGVAVAARDRDQLVQACNGVEQAHAVSGWGITKGARACEADGSTVRAAGGHAPHSLGRSSGARAVSLARGGAPASRPQASN